MTVAAIITTIIAIIMFVASLPRKSTGDGFLTKIIIMVAIIAIIAAIMLAFAKG